jgi:hypothetical protein
MSRSLRLQSGQDAVVTRPGKGKIIASGPTVPTDGDDGYAPGCLFIHDDGAVGAMLYVNEGSNTSADFNAVVAAGVPLATLTATADELNRLDASLATNYLSRGAGVDTAESYASGIYRFGTLIVTQIVLDVSTLIGSATDLDIIGESAAASCHWGQITAAKSGTLIAGRMTCLEVPAGGTTDIDLYASDVSTGTQDVMITDAALGTETALVTSGGAWASGTVKGMTALPTANDYLYLTNGAAAGGTFTAGKFLIEFFGLGA